MEDGISFEEFVSKLFVWFFNGEFSRLFEIRVIFVMNYVFIRYI